MPQTDTVPFEPSGRSKRRWFQFSLRTLLVFTMIVAIGMAGWLYFTRPAPLQAGQPKPDEVVVKVINVPLPLNVDQRKEFLWNEFANTPDEAKFNSYTMQQGRDYRAAIIESLVGKAGQLNLDTASLRKALNHCGSLPVAAYQTTLGGQPVWIIAAKWGESRGGRDDFTLSHINVTAIDQKTMKVVGYVTCM